MADLTIRPCPFCNGAVNGAVVDGSTFRWRRVQGCCADGPEVRLDTTNPDRAAAIADADARAIAAWNQRAALDQPSEAMEALRELVEAIAAMDRDHTNAAIDRIDDALERARALVEGKQ